MVQHSRLGACGSGRVFHREVLANHSSQSGELTTIGDGRTPVSGRASPLQPTIGSRHRPATIGSATATVSSLNRCSAACTTDIVSSPWPHEPTSKHADSFLRSTGQPVARLATVIPELVVANDSHINLDRLHAKRVVCNNV